MASQKSKTGSSSRTGTATKPWRRRFLPKTFQYFTPASTNAIASTVSDSEPFLVPEGTGNIDQDGLCESECLPEPHSRQSRLPQQSHHHGVAMAQPQSSALLQYQLDLNRRREKPSVHDQALFVFEATPAGRIYEVMDAILSIVFCLLYIWNTRYARIQDKYQALPLWSKVLERFLALSILIMYIPRYYLYSRPLDFFFKPFSLVTWLSTVSVLVAWLIDDTTLGPDIDLTYMSAGVLIFLYPARFVRVNFAIHETLRPMKLVYFQLTPISRQVTMLGSTVLTSILTISAVLHIVAYKLATSQDQDPPESTFFDTFFFTTVGTVTGMRSTDVPDTRFTRVVNLVVIAAGVLWLPKKLSNLIQLINSQSVYDRSVAPPASPEEIYVVISGEPEVNEEHLANFLNEFLHVDHGVMESINLKTTILRPIVPGAVLKHVLGDPSLASRVSYVTGTATSFNSLKKVQCHKAKAAFLLASRNMNEDEDEADAKQMMRALSLRKFNSSIRIFAEVHLRENVPNFDFLAETVVCKQELVDGLTAQSIIVPGLASILIMLSTSISDSTIDELTVEMRKQNMPWMKEYLDSLSQEVYTSNFHISFVGMKFIDAVQMVYRHLGVLVIGYGIDMEDHIRRSTLKIMVDPNYLLKGNEICIAIAPDVYQADRISEFDVDSHAAPGYYSDFVSSESDLTRFTPADIATRRTGESQRLTASRSSTTASVHDDNNPMHDKTRTISKKGIELTPVAETSTRHAVTLQLDDGVLTAPGASSPVEATDDSSTDFQRGRALGNQSGESNTSGDMIVQPLVIPVPLTRAPSPMPSTSDVRGGESKPSGLGPRSASIPSVSRTLTDPPQTSSAVPGTNAAVETGTKPSQVGRSPHENGDESHLYDFENHFLICDCSDVTTREFETLLSSIRNSPDPQINKMTVVLLTKKPLAVASFAISSGTGSGIGSSANSVKTDKYEDVHYVAGNPTDRDDMERAGVVNAARCLVLSDTKHRRELQSAQTADARALLAGLNFESMNQMPGSIMVIECLHQNTIKLVGPTRTIECRDDHVKQFLRPSFMSGNIICPTQVDALTSQCFYNPFIVQIFQSFLFTGTGDSHISLIPVPSYLHGRPYGVLVSLALSGTLLSNDKSEASRTVLPKKPGIPIGLRRARTTGPGPGPVLSYPAINAAQNTELKPGDEVYLLKFLGGEA
ncbi:hypothetical protein POJ06DRAFT_10971 [Lipomyces tetrasporus]|uniref:Calcium-activated potassium channel BK alpha subunit domain-containing protein n=1 Tax=Lipomyces tetrasporus TaxID=54092 RepID=A0AAD7VWE2_9ASCO|nr:uncharacterized protein POJ06DRAFT_10971 [Lipomyces tetrasporus]KAJ8104021.1 hypothetical protein POJ06DRAFT_10971 [Lipomyces tetrasporus]